MENSVRIKELKFVPNPSQGWARIYYRCKRHGEFCYRDHQPHSLSNPIIGLAPCGCRGHPRDGDLVRVTDQEGMTGLLDSHEKRLAAKRRAAEEAESARKRIIYAD